MSTNKDPRDEIIEVLNIPTKEEIKQAMHLPTYQDTVNHYFNIQSDEDNSDYMLHAIRLDLCAEEIHNEFDQLDAEDIKDVFRDCLPTVADIVSNFRNFLPTKQEIISLIKVPTKAEIISELQYPISNEQLSLVLKNATNRDDVVEQFGSEIKVEHGIRSKFGILTKQKVIDELNRLKTEIEDEETKEIIDYIVPIVPEYITTDVVNTIIPDDNLRISLLNILNTSIKIPVKTIVDMLDIPDQNDIINDIESIQDNYPSKDDVLSKIPDIECKKDVELLYQNILASDQDIFDSFDIRDQNTIYEKLDVDHIAATKKLPRRVDVVSTFNLPDRITIINSYKKSLPDPYDFIKSLKLPSVIELFNALYARFSSDIVQFMKPFICGIISHYMVRNLDAIKHNMGIQSIDVICNNLLNAGYFATYKQIVDELHLPTYEEMAAQLDVPSDYKLVDGIQQLLCGSMNMSELSSDDNAQFTRATFESLMDLLNPVVIKEAIGEQAYQDAVNTIASTFSSTDQLVNFFKDGD